MDFKRLICAFAAAVLVVNLYGCGPGKRPFLLATVCLRNANDLADFAHLMRSIAQREGGEFIDGSAETQRELEAIGKSLESSGLRFDRPHISRAFNIGVRLGDGVGLMAGDMGTRGYQVVVGIGEGSNPQKAHEFARNVLAEIKERWRVELVPDPEHSGAFPMDDCVPDDTHPTIRSKW